MAKKQRVILYAPPDFDETANVWAQVELADGKASVTLLHDYPDLKPEGFWRVQIEGKTYEVASFEWTGSARRLLCTLKPTGGAE